MAHDPSSRVDSVYLSYLPDEEGEGDKQQQQQQQHNHQHGNVQVPSVTVTPADQSHPALRRPLHLGIATAAANSAARTAQAQAQAQQSAQRPPIQQHQRSPQPSRVQQKLQRNNYAPSSNNHGQQQLQMLPVQNNISRNMTHQQQQQMEHVPRQHHPQQNVHSPRHQQAGQNGMRPFELRGNVPPQYSGPPQSQQSHQQQQQSRRPGLPALQVTVPPQAHQPPRPQQQQRYNGQQQPSPFSSSTETLVGTPYDKNKPYYYNGVNGNKPPPNWSPSSSTGSSSSHTHGHNNAYKGGGGSFMPGHPNSPYGQAPPSSPSIKNFQLQVPTGDLVADPENDRLSPAMLRNTGGPNGGNGGSQKDWWKRFSTVVKENEKREAMAEKMGGKGTKVQSEWLDAQAHRQKKYRIIVGLVAVAILAAIGGGLAYHFVTKDKDSENAVTVPTTHGLDATDAKSSTIAAATTASTTMTMPSPSAVPAGNNLGTRDTSRRAIEERGGMQRENMPLLAARAVHVSPVGHARRHKNLHHLD